MDLSPLEIPHKPRCPESFFFPFFFLSFFLFFFFLRWREDQWGGESRAPEVIGFEGNFEKAPSPLSKFLSALAQPLSAGSPEPAPRGGEARLSIHAERKDSICCVRGHSQDPPAERLVSRVPLRRPLALRAPTSPSLPGRAGRRQRSLCFQLQDLG